MAPHSSTLAWKIPWAEEPGRPQSMGSLRVGHDWATSLSLFTLLHWRRKWQPTPVFLPGESQGLGSLVGSIYGIAQSRTQLKWLSSSSRQEITTVQITVLLVKAERNGLDFYYILNVNKKGLIFWLIRRKDERKTAIKGASKNFGQDNLKNGVAVH